MKMNFAKCFLYCLAALSPFAAMGQVEQKDSLAVEIDAVAVVGRRQTITIKEDGNLSVAAENIPGYKTESAAEILRRMPGVTVRGSAIELQGQAAEVWLDGNKVLVSDVGAWLGSLSAQSLRDVELISNKGAAYDGAAGAVINLVSRRNVENGHRTNLRGGVTVDRRGKTGGDGSLFTMIKRGNVYFNNSLTWNRSPEWEKNRDTTWYASSATRRIRSGERTRTTSRWTDNANVSVDMPHEQRLSANVFLFYNKGDDSSVDEHTLSSGSRQNYLSEAQLTRRLVSGNVSYSSGKLWPFSLTASYGVMAGGMDRRETQNVTQDGVHHLSLTMDTDEKAVEHVAKVDYSQKFFNDRLTLAAGLKGDYNTLDGSVNYTGGSTPNVAFDGNEAIGGVHFTVKGKVAQKMSFSVGTRAEYTNVNIDNRTTGTRAANSYWNLIPSAMFNYFPSSTYSGTLLISSGSLTRPNYEYLMPGVTWINEFSYETGNPNLVARQQYNMGVVNRFFEFLSLRVMGIHTRNRIHRVALELPSGVTEYTYKNCVDSRALDLYLGVPFKFMGNKIYGQLNVNLQRGIYINPRNGFNLLPERKRFHTGSTSLFVDAKLLPRLSINGYVDCKMRGRTLQYDTRAFAVVDLGVSYHLDRAKDVALTFSASDVFNSRKDNAEYYYDNVTSTRESVRNSQVFRLGLSWQFRGGRRFTRDAAYDPNDTSRF
jgi:hypothetical protein